MTMTEPRPAPMFLADATALDFLNTVAAPWGSEIEWLSDGQSLLAWLEESRLAPEDIAAAMQSGALPGELDTVAAQARAFREWFRGFVLEHAGHSVGPKAMAQLEPLNRLLARDDAYGVIVPSEADGRAGDSEDERGHGPGLRWRWRRHWRNPEMLLLPIAKAMADLVCDADFRQVKTCEGPTCTMLFLDTTKGRARRWCSMAVCGNRAKQAAHRARTRDGAAH